MQRRQETKTTSCYIEPKLLNRRANAVTDKWAGEKSASGRVRNSGGQTSMPAEREVKASRRRKGVKAKPNTSSTSPRTIRAAKRRAEALDLRIQGHPYSVIGRHLGVSTAQAARDIETALAEITIEPAKELLKLELRRCDELTAAHYANALDGDVTATNTILRVMAHRAMLMGWSRDQQGAARVVINDGGVGGEPRRLELEFVLPSKRIADMADLEPPTPPSRSSPRPLTIDSSSSTTNRTTVPTSPLRIKPSPDDLTLDPMQPSAFKKVRGGFDWS
jgi:hypothetical protein